MNIINSILVIIGVILAFIFHKSIYPSKVNKENDKVLDEVKDLQTKVDFNNQAIQSEEEKRIQLEKESKDEKANPTTLNSDSDFFNSRER